MQFLAHYYSEYFLHLRLFHAFFNLSLPWKKKITFLLHFTSPMSFYSCAFEMPHHSVLVTLPKLFILSSFHIVSSFQTYIEWVGTLFNLLVQRIALSPVWVRAGRQPLPHCIEKITLLPFNKNVLRSLNPFLLGV